VSVVLPTVNVKASVGFIQQNSLTTAIVSYFSIIKQAWVTSARLQI